MLLRKPAVKAEIYNDCDGEVVNLFRVLRDRPHDLAKAVDLTPFARDEYDDLYSRPQQEPVDRARALIARSFFGSYSKGGEEKSGLDTRISEDGDISALSSFAGVSKQIAAVAARFRNVLIENCDGLELMARTDRADCLCYLDPPYLPATRHNTSYRHELDEEGHIKLLESAKQLSGLVLISGYPSDLYDAALAGWRRETRKSRTDGNKAREEVLWINPAASSALDREHSGIGVTPLFGGVA